MDAFNVFSNEPLTEDDILGTWAGLRPLVKSAETERTADLSRRHVVSVSDSGVVTVTGGKLTTYRKMAADTVDEVVRLLGHGPKRSPTKKLRLRCAEGTEDLRCDDAAGRLEVDADLLAHLVGRYGGEARAVLAMLEADPHLAAPLVPGLPYLRAEAVYAARYEMAHTLTDVLARRTRALLLARDAASEAAHAVAKLLAPELGWSAAETQRQVDEFCALVAREKAMA